MAVSAGGRPAGSGRRAPLRPLWTRPGPGREDLTADDMDDRHEPVALRAKERPAACSTR
ncbi:hypothetical protein [Amycolatopsis saalfeldensis]|uniref:hypothetical protein n=1 Tax=Amycolatopsis saalfeldensis TaxID=394193 RepID=UPI0015A6DB5E|nr:hypothetical protein [Amycolatopsis saalfeldensis]